MKQLIFIASLTLFFSSSLSHAWTITQTFEPNHQPCIEGLSGCTTKDGAIGSRAQFGGSETTYANENAHSGKQSAKNHIAGGSTGKNWGGALNFRNSITEGGELWHRQYVYFPNDYSFTAGPVAKLMRYASGNAWISLLWSSDGSVRASSEIDGPVAKGIFKLQKGTWQAIEMYVKFSSQRGIFRVWKDGKLVFEDIASKTLKGGGDKSSRMIWGTYWNGGAPKSQSHYVDDMVWTTSKPSNRDSKGNAFIGLTTGSVSSSQPEPEVNSPPQAPKLTSK